MSILVLGAIGICAGILAGIFGVGGGLIVVPGLVFILGYGQLEASGTSLVALLGPVGLGGVYAFYKAGYIGPDHIKAGLLIAVGMFVGSFFGAKIALHFPEYLVKRAFCIFMLIVAARMWMQTLK